MKRMSEVFELPLVQRLGVVTESSGNQCGRFNLQNEANAAVRAINNVDALADALGSLIYAVSRGRGESINNQLIAASKAFNAYRGEQ